MSPYFIVLLGKFKELLYAKFLELSLFKKHHGRVSFYHLGSQSLSQAFKPVLPSLLVNNHGTAGTRISHPHRASAFTGICKQGACPSSKTHREITVKTRESKIPWHTIKLQPFQYSIAVKYVAFGIKLQGFKSQLFHLGTLKYWARFSGLNCHMETIVLTCSRQCRSFCPAPFSKHLVLFFRSFPSPPSPHPTHLATPMIVQQGGSQVSSPSLHPRAALRRPPEGFGLRRTLVWLNSLSLACSSLSILVCPGTTSGINPLYLNLISVPAPGDLGLHI